MSPQLQRSPIVHSLPSPVPLILGMLAALALLGAEPVAAAGTGIDPPTEEEETVEDPFGRESPRAMQIGLFTALGSQDAADLAPYIEGADPKSDQSLQRIRAFKTALDNSGELTSRLSLSIDPEGNLADGLDPELEEIGTISIEGGAIPILAKRIETDDSEAIWQVAAETLDQIPVEETTPQIEEIQEADAGDIMLLGAPLWAWVFMVGLGLAMFGAILLAFRLVVRKLDLDNQRRVHPFVLIILAAFPPLALVGVYLLLDRLAKPLGLSIVERTAIERYSHIAVALAGVWLAWRIAGVINRLLNGWLRRTDRLAWIGMSNFVTRLFRLTLVVVAIGALLATFAIDVTTGLAALGIGGIALALGARKAVEDIVGSIMILADKPVRIGDRCKVEGVEGDVIDIGMRSTRIQTLDRTLLTIPNNVFASESIENLALRDRYYVNQEFLLPYDTSPDQIAQVLEAARVILQERTDYIPTECPIRFEGFTPSGFEIRIRCYLKAESHAEGHLIKEDLLLTLLHRIAELGIRIVPAAQRVELAGLPATVSVGSRVSPDGRSVQP